MKYLKNSTGEQENVQVLVATMGQTDFSKLSEMNIQTDVIFANQSDSTGYEELICNGSSASMFTTATHGVGKNRNFALLYATGDYLLFSDDDLRYVDGYGDVVRKAFYDIPDADGIIFNVEGPVKSGESPRMNQGISRVHWYNCLNYGAVRLAVKRTSIVRENITFSTSFGGGTIYSNGEDSLFIWEMLQKGLKLYTYPATTAYLNEDSESTWFKGYGPKYYYDRGALFQALSPRWALLLGLQDLLRHKNYKSAGLSFQDAFKQIRNGIRGYNTLRPFQGNPDSL